MVASAIIHPVQLELFPPGTPQSSIVPVHAPLVKIFPTVQHDGSKLESRVVPLEFDRIILVSSESHAGSPSEKQSSNASRLISDPLKDSSYVPEIDTKLPCPAAITAPVKLKPIILPDSFVLIKNPAFSTSPPYASLSINVLSERISI